jgi:transposase InsO family protein
MQLGHLRPWTRQSANVNRLGDRAAEFRPGPRPAGQFTASFDTLLASVGIEAVRISPRSPRANAYAERLMLTAQTEVTDRMLIFGQRHLRTILARYEAHARIVCHDLLARVVMSCPEGAARGHYESTRPDLLRRWCRQCLVQWREVRW